MTMHDDQHTIDLLRDAATYEREATGADVAAAMHVGRKIRRRRRALQVVGSGGAMAVAVAVLAVGVSPHGGPAVDVVAPAGSGPAPSDGDGQSKAAAAKAAAAKAAANDTKPPTDTGKPTLTPQDEARMAAAADLRHANNRLMLDVLGKDWAATDDADPFGAELIRGTDSDQGLPDEFSPLAGIEVLGGKGSSFSVQQMCAPMVEKGLHTTACTPVHTGIGTVYVQRWTSAPGEWKPDGGRADSTYGTGTTVYLERVDHSLVRVQMVVRGATSATAAGQKTATAWVSKYDQALEKLAADPRVQPHAESADASSVTVSDHDRDQAILQKALGGGFTLSDGKVHLEPGSKKAGELPSGYYGATAELSSMTDAAYRAACSGKNGAQPCDGWRLNNDQYGDMRLWAGRDATNNVMRGELAVYFPRKDGSWLVANVEVTGTNVTAAQSEDAKVVGQWLESLQDALTKAVTDPNVAGTPSTS
jgi:hypothetical protein